MLIRAISPQDPEAYETCGGTLINSLYVLTAGIYFPSNHFRAQFSVKLNFVKATAFASKAQCPTYNVPQAEKSSTTPKKSSKFTLVLMVHHCLKLLKIRVKKANMKSPLRRSSFIKVGTDPACHFRIWLY